MLDMKLEPPEVGGSEGRQGASRRQPGIIIGEALRYNFEPHSGSTVEG